MTRNNEDLFLPTTLIVQAIHSACLFVYCQDRSLKPQ